MSGGNGTSGRAPTGKLHPVPGPPPSSGAPSAGAPDPLDVARALAGKRLLVVGGTGFVGKVTLSMLLHRYPEIGKVFVLVRPGTGGTAEARFLDKVAPTRPFDPLRERHGSRFDEFIRSRCAPVAGDVSAPLLGLSEEDLGRLGGLDLVVNCAGLVDFNPSLELAIQVNAVGARNAVELCRRTGAALVHVSTCFVAGNRDGVVFEDEEIRGYFPRRQGLVGRPREPELDRRDFELEAELADCRARIARIRADADDRVRSSAFRERAAERLRGEGRDPEDARALKLAVGREKRLWISQQLVELGMARARHWGWPNTYTYTKSLGEQSIATADDVRWAIVRPSIVESALRYPFPGWNEGFTTSAPLSFLSLKGHRSYPAAEKAILDVVPVDLVAAGIIAVGADLLEGAAPPSAAGRVYHLASGDVNPFWVRRCIELVGLYRRRRFRDREPGNRLVNGVLARLEPQATSRWHFETFSAPALATLTRAASRLLRERTPKWGAPRISALAGRVADQLDEIEDQLEKTRALFELYMPFIWDNKYVFRCANIREIHQRLSPADRERIPWDPERLDWRHYWLEVHMKGMEEWVFPGLEEESKKRVHSVKAQRDLLELLDAAVEAHGTRVALRMDGQDKERFTYQELSRWADRVARFLLAAGAGKGDRVLLASENRPEWAVTYFGILRAGGVAVPVDAQLSAAEMANLAATSGARIAILSERTEERMPELPGRLAAAGLQLRLVPLHEALRGGPEVPLPHSASPDDVASLIFTSGTTGTPKGVMLTHRNFASLVARLAGVFDLGPGDGLLSVLPLHHTFEFTCGLLVPLSRGAEVEYLDELTADTLGDALEEGRITAMIGVPALWSLLHRRITQEVAARPGFVEEAFHQLMKANAALRDRAGLNLGKLLFWPVHRKMGGRLRILVSGGSALSPEVQKAFHEMGFDLYEGYGLTEAAPVLSVSTPEDEGPRAGHVGKPLPGIDVRIADPDENGVGEVLARGPNVMLGYWTMAGGEPGPDREATEAAIEDGWLRTGDLGKLDADGRLVLVGRRKDVIIDAGGKNVYPDEIEELYKEPDLVKELSVVGLPEPEGEKVAMLVVPDFRDRDRGEVRRRLEEHLRKVSASLPFHKRAKIWHVVEAELPKTSTRKVKRKLVVEELKRLEAAAHKGKAAREARERGGDAWLLDLLAQVSRRPRAELTHQSHLATELGFDSLMLTELQAALEEAGVPADLADDLSAVQTVGELSRLVSAGMRRPAEEREQPARPRQRAAADEIHVPRPVAALGRRLLSLAQRALYRQGYAADVRGRSFIPRDRNFLVVANHTSHLDMGLVKVALGDQGENLAALAAADYFFDTRLKRAYFENFTNLIPMERSGNVRRSLRAAVEALRRGYNLLIFPEGTRSLDGKMAPFKPTAGYLALVCGVDALPVYIEGTHQALPKGRLLPRRADLRVLIGEPIRVEELRRRTDGLPKGEAHKVATLVMEEAVKALRDRSGAERARPEGEAEAAAVGTSAATPGSSPSPSASPARVATSTATSAPAAISTATSTATSDSDDAPPPLVAKGEGEP